MTENRKPVRRGMKRMFERNGHECLGHDPCGYDLWRYPCRPLT